MPKINDDVTATIRYDFDNPVNQAEEEDIEDLELFEELARSIEQKADIIQPCQEPINTINLGTTEDPKEVKLWAAV